mmetsp:Transcript_16547/g.32295  ORF Transcript_16547/g.32295 Transcript_16547/m.32295 type:complete len:511 (+) Transcript_16547:1499-3031(+)
MLLGARGLHDADRGEARACLVATSLQRHPVAARRLQELLCPLAAVKARATAAGQGTPLLQRFQELADGSVAPRVLVEVPAHASTEALHPHHKHQLFEQRRPFAVGDAVEVEEGLVSVCNCSLDRVRGGQLVLAESPLLHAAGEVEPAGLPELGGFCCAQSSHVGSEGLVQPQAIPPHGADQVAEPHVRHLVQHRVRPVGQLREGRGLAVEVVLREGDAPNVLHGSFVELGHKQLVVLVEGIRNREEVLVVSQPLFGQSEEVFCVQERRHALAAVQPERHSPVVVVVLKTAVRPSHQSEEVGGYGRGAAEPVRDRGAALCLLVHMPLLLHPHPVSNDSPGRVSGDSQLQGRPDIRLVEARQHPVALERLKVGVHVLVAVSWVDELVEASAGVVVVVGVADNHRVLRAGGEAGAGQVQAVSAETAGRGADSPPVDFKASDLFPHEVKEQAIFRRAMESESHRQLTVVVLFALLQRQVQCVVHIRHKLAARLGLLLRQIVFCLCGVDILDRGC